MKLEIKNLSKKFKDVYVLKELCNGILCRSFIKRY